MAPKKKTARGRCKEARQPTEDKTITIVACLDIYTPDLFYGGRQVTRRQHSGNRPDAAEIGQTPSNCRVEWCHRAGTAGCLCGIRPVPRRRLLQVGRPSDDFIPLKNARFHLYRTSTARLLYSRCPTLNDYITATARIQYSEKKRTAAGKF